MKRSLILLTLTAPLALAACGDGAEQSEAVATGEPVAEATVESSATAMLRDREGNMVGRAMARETAGTLMISVQAENLPAGTHGTHVHTTGDCSAGDFTSAGDHWNPTDANHGAQGPAPSPHAGDLGNLEIGEDGTGSLEASSTGDFAGLMDADGAALVIHSQADDLESQPSGDAGDRIACGVFERS